MKKTKIYVRLPQRWQELSDNQLYYVYSLLADNLSAEQIKTYCFFRWTGVKIIGQYEKSWEIKQGKVSGFVDVALIAAAVSTLDFLDSFPDTPVRLSKIKKHAGIDATLQDCNFPGWSKDKQPEHRFSFEKYLYCDNLYQGFLETQRHELLVEMAQLLYDTKDIAPTQAEKISIFYWWASLKSLFSKTFCNFLTPIGTEGIIDGGGDIWRKLQESTNAQIRALTGGDITKRKQVLDMDVWSAMWELDAKAKEYNEMVAKYGK